MSENKDTDTLVWYANEPYVSWITYAQQLKYYLLKDSTKRVFVYGREDHKVEYKRVEHGHWENENMDDQVIARCSVCNTWHTMRTPYCPNCGNPLDEEEK